MTKAYRGCAVAVCWTAALALMIAGSLYPEHGGTVLCWAIFVTIVAALCTAWLIADTYTSQRRDDASLEHIIELVDAVHGRGATFLHR